VIHRQVGIGVILGLLVISVASIPVAGQDAGDPDGIRARSAEYSPYLNYDYPDRVFFGDTHLHTSYSTDAGLSSRPPRVCEPACCVRSTGWLSPTMRKTSDWPR